MTDAKIIPLPPPKPRPPEDDGEFQTNLIIPTQIWLEGPKPELRLRPPAKVIPLPTANVTEPAGKERDEPED